MLISGVVILIDPQKSARIFDALKAMAGVTSYGLHKENYIIAVFEAEDEKEMKSMSEDIARRIDGILGIYPTYMQFDENE